jgi:hypothetical protein
MIEVTADVADKHGAFEEHALSVTDAWESNDDLYPDGASNE